VVEESNCGLRQLIPSGGLRARNTPQSMPSQIPNDFVWDSKITDVFEMGNRARPAYWREPFHEGEEPEWAGLLWALDEIENQRNILAQQIMGFFTNEQVVKSQELAIQKNLLMSTIVYWGVPPLRVGTIN